MGVQEVNPYTDDEERLCVICLVNERNTTVLPCRCVSLSDQRVELQLCNQTLRISGSQSLVHLILLWPAAHAGCVALHLGQVRDVLSLPYAGICACAGTVQQSCASRRQSAPSVGTLWIPCWRSSGQRLRVQTP